MEYISLPAGPSYNYATYYHGSTTTATTTSSQSAGDTYYEKVGINLVVSGSSSDVLSNKLNGNGIQFVTSNSSRLWVLYSAEMYDMNDI